jgi:hypothetical protein
MESHTTWYVLSKGYLLIIEEPISILMPSDPWHDTTSQEEPNPTGSFQRFVQRLSNGSMILEALR